LKQFAELPDTALQENWLFNKSKTRFANSQKKFNQRCFGCLWSEGRDG